MKITITKDELRKALQGLSKVVSSRNTMSFAYHVRFAADAGGVTAQATDIDQTATYRFSDAAAGGDGQAFFPLAVLKDAARGHGPVEIETGEGNAVTLTHTVAGHPMPLLSMDFDPKEWPLQGTEIQTSPAVGFLKAYRRMAAFASTDDTRRTLCGVCVDTRGAGERNATLVATDGRRLTCCNSMRLPVPDGGSVIIPRSRFLLWEGLGDDSELGAETVKGASRVCVKAGPWTYRVKAVDGVFPDWRQVIPAVRDAAHRVAFTDPDVEAMRRILPSMPGGDAFALEGAEGRLSLGALDRDSGKALTVPLTAGSTYEGPGCRIFLNRHYLLDALDAGFRNFVFAGPASPLVSSDGNGGTTVLMPLRMSADAGDGAGCAGRAGDPPAAGAAATEEKPGQESKPEKQEKEEEGMNKAQDTHPTPATQAAAGPHVTALERAQASFEKAKASIREVQAALADMASDLREAVREDKQRKQDTESVRSMLAKLQAMKV